MVNYVTRAELNVEKYDQCISKAINSRIYGNSWYLDIVCDNWDTLVLEDYEAVMPLPKRKKYGIHYIYLPPWVQQLGVFSVNKLDSKIIQDFFNAIPRKFRFINVNLNSEYDGLNNLKLKENYILDLNKHYKELYKNYNKGRKSSVSKAKILSLRLEEGFDPFEVIELFKKNKGSELAVSKENYTILENLIHKAQSLGLAKTIAAMNKKDNLIGGAFFLIDNNRITYLFSAIDKEGRDKQAMSLLLDHMINNNSNSNYIFDFEGSMKQEIASFFKSFGATKEFYSEIKMYRGILKIKKLIDSFVKI